MHACLFSLVLFHFRFQEYLWQSGWWSAYCIFCFPHLFSPNLLLVRLIEHFPDFVLFSSSHGSFPDVCCFPKLLVQLALYPCTGSRDPAWIRHRNGNDRGKWSCSAHWQENLVRLLTWCFKSLLNSSGFKPDTPGPSKGSFGLFFLFFF